MAWNPIQTQLGRASSSLMANAMEASKEPGRIAGDYLARVAGEEKLAEEKKRYDAEKTYRTGRDTILDARAVEEQAMRQSELSMRKAQEGRAVYEQDVLKNTRNALPIGEQQLQALGQDVVTPRQADAILAAYNVNPKANVQGMVNQAVKQYNASPLLQKEMIQSSSLATGAEEYTNPDGTKGFRNLETDPSKLMGVRERMVNDRDLQIATQKKFEQDQLLQNSRIAADDRRQNKSDKVAKDNATANLQAILAEIKAGQSVTAGATTRPITKGEAADKAAELKNTTKNTSERSALDKHEKALGNSKVIAPVGLTKQQQETYDGILYGPGILGSIGKGTRFIGGVNIQRLQNANSYLEGLPADKRGEISYASSDALDKNSFSTAGGVVNSTPNIVKNIVGAIHAPSTTANYERGDFINDKNILGDNPGVPRTMPVAGRTVTPSTDTKILQVVSDPSTSAKAKVIAVTKIKADDTKIQDRMIKMQDEEYKGKFLETIKANSRAVQAERDAYTSYINNPKNDRISIKEYRSLMNNGD